MVELVGLAGIIALASKLVDFAKYLRAQDWNAVAAQAATWVAGVLVVLLAAEADILSTVDFGGYVLGDINVWSKVFLGLSLLSLGSVGYDLKKAVDNTTSSRTPHLLPGEDALLDEDPSDYL